MRVSISVLILTFFSSGCGRPIDDRFAADARLAVLKDPELSVGEWWVYQSGGRSELIGEVHTPLMPDGFRYRIKMLVTMEGGSPDGSLAVRPTKANDKGGMEFIKKRFRGAKELPPQKPEMATLNTVPPEPVLNRLKLYVAHVHSAILEAAAK